MTQANDLLTLTESQMEVTFFIDEDINETFVNKFTKALNIKMKTFFRKIKNSISDSAINEINKEILK